MHIERQTASIHKKDLYLLPKNHGFEMSETEDTRKRFDSFLNARQYIIDACGNEVAKGVPAMLIREDVHFCADKRVFSRTYFVENFKFKE